MILLRIRKLRRIHPEMTQAPPIKINKQIAKNLLPQPCQTIPQIHHPKRRKMVMHKLRLRKRKRRSKRRIMKE